MDYFLQFGPVPFVVAKYVLNSHKPHMASHPQNYRMFKGRITGKALFLFVPFAYTALLLLRDGSVLVIIP